MMTHDQMKHSLMSLAIPVGSIVVFWCVFAILMKMITYAVSAIVGAFFSFLIVRDLMRSAGRRGWGSYFLARIVFYAIPLGLAVFYQAYFNLVVLVIFLFSFQMAFVVREGIARVRAGK